MSSGFRSTSDRDLVMRRAVRRRPAVAASSLLDGLISYWPMEETYGVRHDKLLANSLAGSGSGDYVAGKIGNGLPGGGSYSATHNSTQALGTSAFTLAGWVYFGSLSATSGVVTKSNAASARQWELQWNAGAARLRFGISSTSSASLAAIVDATSTGTMSLNTWYHVACWYDGSVIGIHVNGGTVHTTAHTAGQYGTTQPLVFGAFSGGSSPMTGRLDEWGLWSRALTTAERATLYNGGTGLSYPFA